jgi:hypothetical protein
MFEPMVHHQFLHSPIRASNPSDSDLFVIPHYSQMCSGLDSTLRWNAIPEYLGHNMHSTVNSQ